MVQLFTSSHRPVIRAILLLVVALALHLPYAALQADSPYAVAQADSPQAAAQASSARRKHISDDKIKVNPTLAIIIASLIGTFIIMGCVSVLLTQHCIRRQLTLTALESHGVSATNRRRRSLFRRLACTGLYPSIIDALPTFVYSEVKKDGMISLECAVCLSEFENAETLRLLPRCYHVFHSDCIEAWLSTHVTCPVCRSNLAPKPDEVSREPEPESADSVGERANENRRSFGGGTRSDKRGRIARGLSKGHRPKEVRRRLANSTGLSRTKRCVSFDKARSSRKGYGSGSVGISKLGFMEATRPRKVVVVGGGEEVTSTQRLIWGSGSNKEKVDDGKRLFSLVFLAK
ncbi:hypothetical protein RHSIM_Rhsim07G0205600 [Rhododendron simsii]|uniref:RING-type E3 ubiquitin transferase n=1 Tax=Rhododendron simsii TaxID=118357 RepID=A0A834GRH9_RHOSS|nr:hypothetical protein RHSIM_Rhsim07G0205600 [Rhododendron simsii]